MPMTGNITGLLKQEYKDKGYILTEDEDFIYLYASGIEHPYVFSAHGATMGSIHAHIANLERR